MPTRSRPTAPSPVRAPARQSRLEPPPASQRPLLFNFDPGLSKAEQDRRRTQWAVLVTGLLIGLALVVVGIGIYVNGIRQPGLPVAIVDGHVIRRDTWQHYQALLNAEIQGRAAQLQANPAPANDPAAQAQQQAELNALQQQQSGVADQAVQDLIDAQVVAGAIPALEKAGAPASQIVPSSKQVDDAVTKEQQTLGVSTASQLQSLLSGLGMSQTDLRNVLTARLEEDNITAYLSRDLQSVQPQVKARIMSFGDKSKADAALQALRSGQSWDSVNAQYAKDQAAKETSRDVDWSPKGVEDTTFDQFAFSAKPFQVSDVLPDNGNYVIIQVEDVGPARPLSTTQTDQIKSKTYNDWLAKQTSAANVQRYPKNMI